MTPDDEAALRSAYEAMFGTVPDMVAARIRFVGEVAPRFQSLTEALRSDALGNGVLDARTVQLFLFGLLLSTRPDAAAGHAAAARRLGAGFDVLLTVVELVSMAGAVGARNVGGAYTTRSRLRRTFALLTSQSFELIGLVAGRHTIGVLVRTLPKTTLGRLAAGAW